MEVSIFIVRLVVRKKEKLGEGFTGLGGERGEGRGVYSQLAS